MIIRSEDWERIRAQFTEAEKAALRKAVTGETICPRGWCVEDERIPMQLFNKLYAALKGAEMRCPYCGSENVTCDTVDIGVGYQQCGPYGCDVCHAVEISSAAEAATATEEERKIGWFRGPAGYGPVNGGL